MSKSSQLVYKVKTTDLLEKAAPWNNCPAEQGQPMCDELKACMDQITDITFVVDNCIQAALPTAESMYDLLLYAKQRVSFRIGPNFMSEFSKSEQVCEIHKL